MNKKIIAFLFIALVLAVFFLLSTKPAEINQQEEIVINVDGSLPETTTDDLIKQSEIIVIGEVVKNLPSKWKSPDGAVPAILTPRKIIELDLSIFTDSLISIEQVIKGEINGKVVRVRSFKGEIDNVRFESSSEPSYIVGEKYLLFLHKDNGPTQIVDPGDYISVGAFLGTYHIQANKAISHNDEWELDTFIDYIKSSQ